MRHLQAELHAQHSHEPARLRSRAAPVALPASKIAPSDTAPLPPRDLTATARARGQPDSIVTHASPDGSEADASVRLRLVRSGDAQSGSEPLDATQRYTHDEVATGRPRRLSAPVEGSAAAQNGGPPLSLSSALPGDKQHRGQHTADLAADFEGKAQALRDRKAAARAAAGAAPAEAPLALPPRPDGNTWRPRSGAGEINEAERPARPQTWAPQRPPLSRGGSRASLGPPGSDSSERRAHMRSRRVAPLATGDLQPDSGGSRYALGLAKGLPVSLIFDSIPRTESQVGEDTEDDSYFLPLAPSHALSTSPTKMGGSGAAVRLRTGDTGSNAFSTHSSRSLAT